MTRIAPVEIRSDASGEIDEILASKCDVHIEMLSTHDCYLSITASDGSYWGFWVGAKNGKSHIEFRCTETTLAKEPTP